MLLAKSPNSVSLMVVIWSLRSVPISLLILMFVFNSGSVTAPQANLHFWFDTLAVLGIIGIIAYWNQLQRLRWNVSLTIYLYIFLVFLLRNPYGVLTNASLGRFTTSDWQLLRHGLEVWLGIFALGMSLEVLIRYLRQCKQWAWWVALMVSIAYVSSIIFFCSGTLGIWSLLDPDTKRLFKRATRQQR